MEMRISDELNDIIKYSREEAMRTGCYGIGIEHLFLGMLRHSDNDACRILRALGLDEGGAKLRIDAFFMEKAAIPYSDIDQIGLTRMSQSLLNLSILEATRFRSPD